MFLLLAACDTGTVAFGDDTASPDRPPIDDTPPAEDDTAEQIEGSDTSPVTTDSAATDTTDTTDTTVETWPKACDEIYDPDTLQEFDLTFSADQWNAVQRDCQNGVQQYRPVALTWNGETVDAQARLKGNWSWSCDKLQFVVSFNESDPDARWHGLRKVVFDAPWYDRTFMHERIAFPLFEARGLPYSCANNARLSINGEYYGIYANTERLDHEYLERNFEEYGGNLYQGGTELKTNEDIGDTSDIQALQAATTVEELETMIDLDEAVAEWATEAMIPAMDNYWAGVEINYYLYDHPSRGFVYLPYDLDLSFGDGAYTDGSLVWPDAVWSDPILYEHYGWLKEPLFETVLADPHWCDRFVEELELSRAAYDPAAMAVEIDAWDAQIEDSVAGDDHKPFSTNAHRQAVSDLKSFLVQRAEVVDDWLAEGGHCPARW